MLLCGFHTGLAPDVAVVHADRAALKLTDLAALHKSLSALELMDLTALHKSSGEEEVIEMLDGSDTGDMLSDLSEAKNRTCDGGSQLAKQATCLTLPQLLGSMRAWGSPREARLMLAGLDGAGKTTVLYRLKNGHAVTTVPTMGFNVESLEYGKLRFTIWDLGGQEMIRRAWRHYAMGTEGLVFVVDSCDHARIEDASEELHMLLRAGELRKAKVLVYANKQDMPGAMTAAEIAEKLGLYSLVNNPWSIQQSCAIHGDGLYEGINWLAAELSGQAVELGTWL